MRIGDVQSQHETTKLVSYLHIELYHVICVKYNEMKSIEPKGLSNSGQMDS